ncbi:MAG: lamin tail domain-containing protein [Bacteroidales bacterium]|nr:lamin tail domain-containing protein [Bacteroidales bacterium]
MRHYRIILSIAITFLCGLSLDAQNLSDLLIGEVLVENTSGIVDGYGQRNGWIELFNTSNGTVKFGGCYLSDDKSDLKKYHIPTSDRSAQLGPRQSVVFYTSGNSSQGTFYTNFKLRNGSTLYLISNDGRTIIDQVEIPADLPADQSVVRIPVGVNEMEFKTQVNPNPTPGSYNGNVDAKTKSQIMKEQDPHGLVLTLIAVMVVFTALLILSFIFGWIGNANKRGKQGPKVKKSKKSLDGKLTPEIAAAISLALSSEFGGEVYAAIALALDDYLRGGVHDIESMVITIQPSGNGNWADKTQNFRQLPR